MEPYFLENYGAPTTEYGHSFGLTAREALEKAREIIASSINAEPDEIIFTSGGTESNNLAIKGVASAGGAKKIITSKIEHRSVLTTVKSLGEEGFTTFYLDVDREGFISMEQLKNEINGSSLISIQHANQEIGTIQDIATVGEICRENNALFHVDAVQSYMKERIDVKKMGIDLLSVSSHLIHGPKGVGALYKRKDVRIRPILDGEHHEFGFRAGTENVPCIAGFAKAVEIFRDEDIGKMRSLRDRLIKGLLEVPNSKLNGPVKMRLCNNVNISFRYVEGESLLLHLDMRGVITTTGSACFSPTLDPSHVILAIGGTHEDAHGSVRFSLSRYNTNDEIDYTIGNVKEVVEELRKISPLGK
jgi:cysteine desulfurase